MEFDSNRPILYGLVFCMINGNDNAQLIAHFAEEEIKKVRGCDGDKSPGPDGFNLAFIKDCWEVLKGDIHSLPQ